MINNLIAMEENRGTDIRKVFEDAMLRMDECDGVVILMQKKKSGILWFAPDSMRFETIIFYLWTAMCALGR